MGQSCKCGPSAINVKRLRLRDRYDGYCRRTGCWVCTKPFFMNSRSGTVLLHRGNCIVELAKQRMVLRHHQTILFAGLNSVFHGKTLHLEKEMLHAGYVRDDGVDTACTEIEKQFLLRVVALDIGETSGLLVFLDPFFAGRARKCANRLAFQITQS